MARGIVNQPALVDLPRPQRVAVGSIASQTVVDVGTSNSQLITPLTLANYAQLNRSFAVTHTSDTALATRASGGTQIGATISNATIPTSGVIRVTLLEAEFDETGSVGIGRVAMALDVGGTKVWASNDIDDGAAADFLVADINVGVSSYLVGAGITGGEKSSGIDGHPAILSFDIVAGSFPTGSRDIQIYMGDEANSSTGAVTLTGTTVTARILVEVIDTT